MNSCTTVRFDYPTGLAVDTSNNIYITDTGFNRICKFTSKGDVNAFASDSAEAEMQFNRPHGAAIDSAGNVYVTDENNYRVCKITPEGLVNTLAGGTQGVRDGIGTEAQFNNLDGVAVNTEGDLYIADSGNRRICKMTQQGVVSAFAGSIWGFRNDLGKRQISKVFVA